MRDERSLLVIDPELSRAEIPALCARLADLVPAVGRVVVVCDVSATVDARMVTVEALVQLRLTARQLGTDMRVHGVHPRLRQLLAFAGLDDIVLFDAASALEPQRQAEQGEQALHVKEVGDATDPAV